MHKLLWALALVTALSVGAAGAQDTIRIGFIAPSIGQFAQIGNQMIAGGGISSRKTVRVSPAKRSSF